MANNCVKTAANKTVSNRRPVTDCNGLNAAKMREALAAYLALWDNGTMNSLDELKRVIKQMREALSAPARPCDTMNWRDAWEKWKSESYPATPVTYKECYESTTVFMDWYMSEEGDVK